MKKTICFCDRCGEEIVDIVFTVTCYAEDLNPGPFGGVAAEVVQQNSRQNHAIMDTEIRHLCRKCKDEITDGIFVV